MTDNDRDTQMRMAAFEHVRGLNEVHDLLTAKELKPGFVFDGERIPLINPQRGISSRSRCDSCFRSRPYSRDRAPKSGTTISETFIARF